MNSIRLFKISFTTILAFATSCTTLNPKIKTQGPTSEPNFLIIDSSFAPLEFNGVIFPPRECTLINENDDPIDPSGPCFDMDAWSKLGKENKQLLEGFLDASAKIGSSNAAYWKGLKNEKNQEALNVQNSFKILTHGTRSALLASTTGGNQLRPLLVRSVTSQAGANLKNSEKCNLKKYSDKEIQQYSRGGLRPHQERLAAILSQYPGIRVVNLSLGYKRSWIKEDNPNCNIEIVEREYQVLKLSWRNLIARFSDRIFVVAAGNEKADFSVSSEREDDLWAKLSGLPNLLLVGSLNQNRQRTSFTNFGICKMAWENGDSIPIQYPYPGRAEGYPSQVNGTSSSAPLVAGKLFVLLNQGENLSLALSSQITQLPNCYSAKLEQ